MTLHIKRPRIAANPSFHTTMLRRIFLSLVFAMGALSAQAATIYNISDDFGTATLSGTITTDGTIGAVGNGNIVDWTIILTAGTTTTTLTKNPLNSELFGGNGLLLATSTQLAFNHAVDQIFLIRDFAIQNFWCLEGPNNGCFGSPSSSNVSVGGRTNQHINGNRTGLYVYGTTASPVPLPAGGLLFLTGFAGLMGLRLVKRTSA